MERDHWSELSVEDRAMPRPISDSDFREWMSERRIFISSVMDTEMTPSRQAMRALIESLGGHPEMWEVLAPRDQHPERAYLEGVSRSNVCLLLLGTSYGVSDETGYSPTEKENNRAKELGIYRLLFQPEGLNSSERDGKLNRFVASIYNEVSAGKYRSLDDLVSQVERKLRDLASAQEADWIRLGNLLFPGTVTMRSRAGRTTLTVRSRVRQHPVRQGFAQLSQRSPRDLVLTWGAHSYAVQVEDLEIESGTSSEDVVTVTCQPSDRRVSRNPLGHMGVTIQSGSRTVTPAEQAERWARQAVLGEAVEMTGDHLLDRFNTPATTTLPELLHRLNAQGWLAEGVTKLFIVEELTNQYGATFSYLRVGPATAAGVRVEFTFSLNGHEPTSIEIEGIVPLS